MTAQANSHYRIIEKIATSRGGELYKAEDLRLSRVVVLKVLAPDLAADPARARGFIEEAKAASSLNHPNICVIDEIGETEDGRPFIAMEYVWGGPLDAKIAGRPLPLDEIIETAAQVADALDEAHSKGIIHRDINPSNIMVTNRGQVKVLDFGAARLSMPGAQNFADDVTEKVVYSPALHQAAQYMSPEQARGEPIDHRTDIYSLGILMYEMATGRLPNFTGTGGEPAASITRFNYDIPQELWQVVSKCIEKDPDRRYQSARELLNDLRGLKKEDAPMAGVEIKGRGAAPGTAGPARRLALGLMLVLIAALAIYLIRGAGRPEGKTVEAIAVLPFTNAGNNPDVEYLSDGITESIINSLSRLSKLRVVPWSTTFRYKNQSPDPQVLGRDLGVDAVLTGRVVQLDGTLVIKTDLVEVPSSLQLWGQQYNRKHSDIIKVQEEIATEISEQLRIKLTGEESKLLTKRYTENAEAYELYLKGRYFWGKRNRESYKRAIEYFQKAIDLDPNYALAYAGLADCYVLGGGTAHGPKEFMPKAVAAANKALELDETLAEAHTSLAKVKLSYEWDFAGAEREFRRAIELSKDYATAHQWYGVYLSAMGRHDESIAARKRAQDLDPTSLSINSGLGRAYYWARRYEQAMEQIRETHDLEPRYTDTHWSMGLYYEQKRMYGEAIREFQEAVALSNRNPIMIAALGHAYALAGRRAEALGVIRELKEVSNERYVSAYPIALIHVALGSRDLAFEQLEKAYEERDEMMTHLKVDPRLDSLRPDARFQRLIERVGFK